jgi:hypothetical protein
MDEDDIVRGSDAVRKFFELPMGEPIDWELAARRLYKATMCGAWIRETPRGIAIGSIVEGADCDCQTHEFLWTEVTVKSINSAIDQIEEEADEIWHVWNDPHSDDPRANGWVGDDGLP